MAFLSNKLSDILQVMRSYCMFVNNHIEGDT